MQIKPVKGTAVFAGVSSSSKEIYNAQLLDNLWHNFSVIILKTNHRQGEDGEYAELLNRLRVGACTEDDVKMLDSRVTRIQDLPEDALYVAGSNADVNNFNLQQLNKQSGSLLPFKASVFSDTRGVIKQPFLKPDGAISGTPLQYELKLKIGCRVMLTTNLDVCDGLVNGSLGTVLGFEHNKKKQIQYIMVKFDDKGDGKRRRKDFDFEAKYPGEDATAIEKFETTFSQSKDQGRPSSQATAIGFPLKLCYAGSAHKIQGCTVKKPKSLILKLDGYMQNAMGYVMLSRVQCLSQLYIVGTLPMAKIKPFPAAVTELRRLHEADIALQKRDYNQSVVSLNASSLQKHFKDVEAHHSLISHDVICIQETWMAEGSQDDDNFNLPHMSKIFANKGRGKGVVTYFSDQFQPAMTIVKQFYQLASVRSDKMVVVNIYRSREAKDEEFLSSLMEIINEDIHTEAILVMGDFNFCERDNSAHPIRQALLGEF